MEQFPDFRGWIRRSKSTARPFAAGAVGGFLGGAFLVATVVWHHGNVIGSAPAGGEAPTRPPSAVERWTDGADAPVGTVTRTEPAASDAAGDVVVRGHPAETPVPTAGVTPPVVAPPPSPEPVLEAPPASELADRDLAVPVDGVTPNQLTRSFSERRGTRQHEAIDILAPRDTPVRAVEDGTIARLFKSNAGGITIYQFDTTERFCYYYAHLERYAEGLQEGQHVRKGQVIGYVGTSGNAPAHTPHLHFAIFRLTSAKRWWEGTPLDPFDVLR